MVLMILCIINLWICFFRLGNIEILNSVLRRPLKILPTKMVRAEEARAINVGGTKRSRARGRGSRRRRSLRS